MRQTENHGDFSNAKRMETANVSDSFLSAMPKADLHLHLDGSIRMQTLIELAQEQNIELPAYSETELRGSLFKEQYANLGEYLLPFKYLCAVLCKPDALERVAYELAVENYEENVFYTEPRFCPQLHSVGDFSLVEVIESVDRGMKKAQQEVNSRPEVVSGDKPKLEYGLIICALRKFDSETAVYFKDFLRLHQGLTAMKIYQSAAVLCAQAAVIGHEKGYRVVGFDIAGDESSSAAEHFHEAFSIANEHLLKKTVHAGEADGPSSIYHALVNCHADRIGHGLHIFDKEWVRPLKGNSIFTPEALVTKLVDFVASKHICIEACLTSNWDTHPDLALSKTHPITEMLRHNLCVTLCCDNKLVSRTNLMREYKFGVTQFGINAYHIRELVLNGFRSSFFYGSYQEKLEYFKTIEEYYTKQEVAHGIISLE